MDTPNLRYISRLEIEQLFKTVSYCQHKPLYKCDDGIFRYVGQSIRDAGLLADSLAAGIDPEKLGKITARQESESDPGPKGNP